MKKKVFFLFLIMVLLTAALASCGLFGSSGGKVKLTEDMIYCNGIDSTYVYTGYPVTFGEYDISVRLDGDILDMDLFEITYADNVEAGRGSVTITAKDDNPHVKGSVTLYFTIVATSDGRLEGDADLAALLASPSVSGVTVWRDYVIPEGVTITVPEGKTLSMIYGYALDNHGTLVNNGKIVMRGALLSTGGRRATELTNYGKIENHGEIEIKDYVTINDLGVFESDSEIVSSGTIYLLDEDKSFLKDGVGGVRFVRQPLTADKLSVEQCVYKQNQTSYTPRVTIDGGAGVSFDAQYFDNTAAGEAGVTVTIGEREKIYYGSATVRFPIEKGVAAVTNYEELSTLAASGNFKTYQVGGLTLGAEDEFTLRAGETLTVSAQLSVGGAFRNRGTVSCASLRVTEGGVFENDGSIHASNKTYPFEVAGSFTNEEQGTFSVGGSSVRVLIGGTFVNKGSLNEKRFFAVNGTLDNRGTLAMATDGFVQGTFTNSGVLTFPQGFNLSTSGTFVNQVGGRVTFGADSESILMNSADNQGTIMNGGKIALEDGSTIRNQGGTFDNSQGGVWSFAAIDGIVENLVVRRYLTDISVLFEYKTVSYDKTSHIPSIEVEGEPLDRNYHSVTLRYVEGTKVVTECVKTGEVQLTIGTRTRYTRYAGSLTYTYSILPSTIRVATSADFADAASDAGYDRIVLDGDLELNGSSYSIGRGCTLDLNGHRLAINNYFYLYGALVGGAPVPETLSVENASIYLSNTAFFRNYGLLTNNGLFYVKDGGSFYGNAKPYGEDTYGTVVNEGAIYTNNKTTLAATGGGVIYVRRDAEILRTTIVIPDVYYDGTVQHPIPSVYYQTQLLDNARFNIDYDDRYNVDAGDLALIKLTVVDPFDHDLYGKINKNFTIKRGTATLYGESDLISAAANVNYDTLRFSKNITLRQAVTLADGQTIDLGAYELSVDEKGKVYYGKNCRLVLTAGNEERFLKYVYAADEITLTADIGVADAETEMTFTGYTLPTVYGANYLSTLVHLDGYSFLGGLRLGNSKIEYFSIEFENSSETKSRIGTEVGGVALHYDSCSEETEVTIRNVTVYGASMGGGYNTAQYVRLIAENCDFLASTTTAHACAFTVFSTMSAECDFTDCTFVGSNAFRANQGELLFTSCSFSSYDEYSEKYNDNWGDALFLPYSGRHGMDVTVSHCVFYSKNGHGIRLMGRNNAVSLSVDSFSTFDCKLSSVVG